MRSATRGVKLFCLAVASGVALISFCLYRASDVIGSIPDNVIPDTGDMVKRVFIIENEAKSVPASPKMSTVLKHRRDHVTHHCATMTDHSSQRDINEATDRMIQDKQLNLLYCPVPKNGCSFWKRVFSVLSGHHEGSAVFNLSSTAIHTARHGVHYLSGMTPLEKMRVLQNSTKFVFARDPYERLFSGYLDKFFAPDAQHQGMVVKKFRIPFGKDQKRVSYRHRRDGDGGGSVGGDGGVAERTARSVSSCGPDDSGVTFREFLEYVSNTVGVPVNDHFGKQHSICLPCRLGFDLVGKMETFRQDAEFILRSVGVEPATVWGPEDRFEENSDLNIMDDVAHRSFSRCNRSWCQCLSPYQFAQRLWVLFQARGFLPLDEPLPLTRAESRSITLKHFQALARTAYFRVPEGQRAVVKRQRYLAMMEAYHSVEPALLSRVQRYVSEDCELFGYACSIEERFNLSTIPDVTRFHFEETLRD